MLLLATLLIGGMIFTSCSKDPTPTPTPTPSNTIKMVYKVDNSFEGLVMSDCFKLNVTYLDANGKEVSETAATLPWTKEIDVTKPFHAKMSGQLVYNEQELPDTVVFGKYLGIGYYQGSALVISLEGNLISGKKEKFLNLMAQQPDKLKFTVEKDF